MNSIQPAIAELERAYRALTVRFSGGMSDDVPVITIQSKGRKNAAGWLGHRFWRNGAEAGINELTITAEHLARPVEDIAEVLIHEMVHHYNELRGVRDCTPAQYHNRVFRDVAESVGLVVERHASRGFATTSLGPDLLPVVRELNIDQDAFSLFRRDLHRKKSATRMKKWTCGCTIVRCATALDAVCVACGQPFVNESEVTNAATS